MENQYPKVFDSKILVAISGGIDSVVLAYLCKQIKLDFALAHCNFGLRDSESDADEGFVVELADHLGVEVFVKRFHTHEQAEKQKVSVQMAARNLRYSWFNEIKQTQDFNFIFTGHQANDDLETFLINFIRGTGLDGLTGIPAKNEDIIRPMLAFSREEIKEYAENLKINWREDSSNRSKKYLRNKIRKEIIPILTELNPRMISSFQETRSHLAQSADLVGDYLAALFPKIAKEEDFGYSFNIRKLKMIPNSHAVLYELFKSFGFSQWNDIYHLLEAQAGKVVLSPTHRLVRDREALLLTVLPKQEHPSYTILPKEEVIMLPIGTFYFEEVEEIGDISRQCIYVDAEKLEFPLYVRKWKEGDYFYPFGMEGKKKLSKFFKDERLSLPQKESCWLLCTASDVIWVIGYRADARFAIGKNTNNMIRITFTP